MAGDTLKIDEIVKIIENTRGVTMDVTYRQYEEIEKEETKEEVFYPDKFWLQIELLVGRNAVGEGIVEPDLNELCPHVEPLSVEEYMRKFWA